MMILNINPRGPLKDKGLLRMSVPLARMALKPQGGNLRLCKLSPPGVVPQSTFEHHKDDEGAQAHGVCPNHQRGIKHCTVPQNGSPAGAANTTTLVGAWAVVPKGNEALTDAGVLCNHESLWGFAAGNPSSATTVLSQQCEGPAALPGLRGCEPEPAEP